jgi:hypothetical protein
MKTRWTTIKIHIICNNKTTTTTITTIVNTRKSINKGTIEGEDENKTSFNNI